MGIDPDDFRRMQERVGGARVRNVVKRVLADTPRPRRPVKSGYNPRLVAAFLADHGLPVPVFEHRFHEHRMWRFDLAWPDRLVAVEVQGGLFSGGRHNRGRQMLDEYEKGNEAATMGWRVIHVTPDALATAGTVETLKKAFVYRVEKT